MPTAAPTPPAPATNPTTAAAEASTSSRTVTIPGFSAAGETVTSGPTPGTVGAPSLVSVVMESAVIGAPQLCSSRARDT